MALTDRQYFALKKLHSLSGVVPVGLFLLEHVLYTNSFSTKGAAAYNAQVEFLTGLPYLYLIEVFGIFLPIAFHAALGVYIGLRARHNLRTHAYRHNYMFMLQRVSGFFLVLFIALHVWKTRFSGASDLFVHMSEALQNPGIFAFYVLGVTSAAFHFGNGLWGFCISWGITVSAHSQRLMHAFGMAVFLTIAIVGINSLLGFRGEAITFLQRPAGAHTHAEDHAAAPAPARAAFDTDRHAREGCICPPGKMLTTCPVCFPAANAPAAATLDSPPAEAGL